MKKIYFAVFIIAIFSTIVSSQTRNYTGAGYIASDDASSSTKSKHRKASKDIQPTNSVTIIPAPNLITYDGVTFKPTAPHASCDGRIALQGAKIGDKVNLYVPRGSALPGMKCVAWVSANDEITVRFTNTGEVTQCPEGKQVFKVLIERH